MGRKLYVGNLGFDVTNQELEDAFAAVGTCASVAVITERDTGRSRGFGFVEMSSDAEAAKAITELDGKEIKGRAIRVSQAQDNGGGGRGRSGGGGGGGGYGGRGGGGGWRRWRRTSLVVAGKAFVGRLGLRDRTQPRSGEPHRKLMAAVLQAVIDDVCDAAARTNAVAYVRSDDRTWPFSFENLCDALDMDAGNVRRQLNVEMASDAEAAKASTPAP